MKISNCIAFLISSIFTVVAGPDPSICIDGDLKTTDRCEPVAYVTAGEPVLIGIMVKDVRSVHSFSIKVGYNSENMRFNESSKSASWRTPPFLESKGGKQAAFLTFPKNGEVEIAATSAGADSTTLASGDGLLCVLKFTALKSGDPGFQINNAGLLDLHGKSIQITNENKERK